mgnify:CR=1 FL=1
MSRAIALANQKGGVGKTTTAVHLAAGLALAGRTVLLVDLDPQANATSGLGVELHTDHSTHPLARPERPDHSQPVPSGRKRLTILPSTPDLLRVEQDLQGDPVAIHRLRNFLSSAPLAEYIILDCPPSLGLLTRNALVAADGVIVPIQCEYYAMEGLTRILRELDDLKRHQNPGLELAGILLTMHDPGLELSCEVIEEVRANFPDDVFETLIPRDVTLSEASSYGQTVFEYERRSRAAYAYAGLTREVLADEQT